MAKKAYTILIIPQKAAKVKKFILSPLTLKIAAVVFGVVFLVSGFIVYEYVTYKRKVTELKKLRTETRSQQAEIRSFVEKIVLLEEQLNKLEAMEKQVAKDLKEVTEMKKVKKVTPAVHKKKYPKLQEVKQGAPSPPKDEVSVLVKERSKLVSRLHQDLIELRKEAFQREQNLKELQGFLQEQKSILASTPSLWPVFGRITSAFGDTRLSAFSGGTRPHKGVDISAPLGTPIFAPSEGVVTIAGQEAEYGRLVCVDHGHGFTTMYGHLREISVRLGDRVRKGQKLGTVGLSGNSTGSHLHYEVRLHGSPINPFPYLKQSS